MRICPTLILSLVPLLATQASHAFNLRKSDFHEKRAESFQRLRSLKSRDQEATSATPKNITFSNPKASEFYVDGTTIPEVDWDVGASWAGLLPISNKTDETRKLFFWFFPPGPEGSLDDIIFWTNGGPGCSSMEGFLQENGPITWSWGTAKPTQNEWSWTNLSSVLWVEQPVGTGYSQGIPTIEDEDDLAEQLVGFFNQFLEVFSELKGKNLYLSGESYAGVYVPYIANYIYENPSALPDWNLKGIWIADPLIGPDVLQQQVIAYDFLEENSVYFALTQKQMRQFAKQARDCGYAGYLKKYLKYPPRGPLPFPGNATIGEPVSEECDIFLGILFATLEVNPAFNIYRISDVYPILWDVLGFPGTFPNEQTSPVYFDRPDVKAVVHAPANVTWEECSSIEVFPNGDASPPSSFYALPNVIEKSARTVIIHGLADYVLMAHGARLAIQNMTWSGQQGFRHRPGTDNFHVEDFGTQGSVHTERGLTYYEVKLAGHMIPQFVPWASTLSMKYLMGFRDTPTDPSP